MYSSHPRPGGGRKEIPDQLEWVAPAAYIWRPMLYTAPIPATQESMLQVNPRSAGVVMVCDVGTRAGTAYAGSGLGWDVREAGVCP